MEDPFFIISENQSNNLSDNSKIIYGPFNSLEDKGFPDKEKLVNAILLRLKEEEIADLDTVLNKATVDNSEKNKAYNKILFCAMVYTILAIVFTLVLRHAESLPEILENNISYFVILTIAGYISYRLSGIHIKNIAFKYGSFAFSCLIPATFLLALIRLKSVEGNSDEWFEFYKKKEKDVAKAKNGREKKQKALTAQ